MPEVRSTRLVWVDQGRVRWWYLAIGEHCHARFTGAELVCGAQRFTWDLGELRRLTPIPDEL